MKIKVPLMVIAAFLILVAGYFGFNQFAPNVLGKFGICRSLSYEKCVLNKSCMTISGPSFCNGNTCTADVVFKGCRVASKDILDNRKQDAKRKSDCEKLGATYDMGYKICRCGMNYGRDYFQFLTNGGPQKFFANIGYKTAEALCKEKQGEWISNYESIDVVPIREIITGKIISDKEGCKDQDYGCYDYLKREEGDFNCFYRWDDKTGKCNLAVYNANEIKRPCKIGNEFVTAESLFQ